MIAHPTTTVVQAYETHTSEDEEEDAVATRSAHLTVNVEEET